MKMSEKESYNWYVLLTAFRAEVKAKEQLDAVGIRNYLPFKTVRFQWQNRSKVKNVPTVARCIFVCLSHDDLGKLTTISSLLLPADFDDCRLSDEQMRNVRLLFRESNTPVEWIPTDDVFGPQVQVISGVYQGLMGELLQDADECRVLIRLNKIVNFRVTATLNELKRT